MHPNTLTQFLLKHWLTIALLFFILLPAVILGVLWIFSLDWPLAIGVSIIIGIGIYGDKKWLSNKRPKETNNVQLSKKECERFCLGCCLQLILASISLLIILLCR